MKSVVWHIWLAVLLICVMGGSSFYFSHTQLQEAQRLEMVAQANDSQGVKSRLNNLEQQVKNLFTRLSTEEVASADLKSENQALTEKVEQLSARCSAANVCDPGP